MSLHTCLNSVNRKFELYARIHNYYRLLLSSQEEFSLGPDIMQGTAQYFRCPKCLGTSESKPVGDFSPLEVAKAGGFTDLATPKYKPEEFDDLFTFSKLRFQVRGVSVCACQCVYCITYTNGLHSKSLPQTHAYIFGYWCFHPRNMYRK